MIFITVCCRYLLLAVLWPSKHVLGGPYSWLAGSTPEKVQELTAFPNLGNAVRCPMLEVACLRMVTWKYTLGINERCASQRNAEVILDLSRKLSVIRLRCEWAAVSFSECSSSSGVVRRRPSMLSQQGCGRIKIVGGRKSSELHEGTAVDYRLRVNPTKPRATRINVSTPVHARESWRVVNTLP